VPQIRDAETADALAVARVHVRSWQVAYRGLIADQFLDALRPEERGHDLDGRSDVYAIGIMAYEMLTGELPFGEIKLSTDIIHFHLQMPAPPPSRIRHALHIPSAVDAVVLKMVAKSPRDRHADAAALRQHLAEALASLESGTARRETLRMLAVIGALALLVTGIVVLFTR